MNPPAVAITGATGGIGSQLARKAAADGWLVAIGYRHAAERARELAVDIRATGGSAIPVRLPLEDQEELARGLEYLSQSSVHLQALALCASPPPLVASFVKTPADAFRQQLDATVIGNHFLIAETWKRFFRHRQGGHVVAVLSAALGPPLTPHLSSYLVAKSALLTLLESALAELGPAGLRCTILHPGFTETSMLQAFPEHLLEIARRDSPSGRFLSPEAVAEAALRCLQSPPTDDSPVSVRLTDPCSP